MMINTMTAHADALPNRRELNAVEKMLRLMRLVDVPGPPAVIVYTSVYCLNHQTLSRMSVVTNTGRSPGTVT